MVNGVGEHKYEKYGQLFLDAILEYTSGVKQILYYEGAREKIEQRFERTSTRKSKYIKKVEFHLTDDIKQGIRPLGKVSISQFVDHLNDLRDESTMKRLAGSHLT